MGAADGLRARLGQAEMLHLARRDEVAHRARHLLDRHGGIDPVLIEQVDRLDPQPPQRLLGDLPDARGLTVDAALSAGPEIEAELGGDDHLAAEGLQRLADEALIGEGAVDFGSVEEGDATLDRRADQADHLVPVRDHAAVMVHAHAAETDGRDGGSAASKPALLHDVAPKCLEADLGVAIVQD
jgi:hypothetical protein